MAHGWRSASAASHLVRVRVRVRVRVGVRIGVRVRTGVRVRIWVRVGVGFSGARGEDDVRRLVVAWHADVDVVARLELGMHVGRGLVVRPRLREADHLVRVRVRARVGVRVRVRVRVRARARARARARVKVSLGLYLEGALVREEEAVRPLGRARQL